MTGTKALRLKAVKILPWLFLAAILGGCADITQYSINSFQGTLPIEDYRYVQINSENGAPSSYTPPETSPTPESPAGATVPRK